MPALDVHRFGPAGGQPVVALHGLRGDGRTWRALASGELSACQVVAPDLRVRGPSWTLERHAADVLATMDGLGIERAAVLGLSLGATVSVYLARQAPQRVDRLILLDPAMEVPATVADRLGATAYKQLARPAVTPLPGTPTLLVVAGRSRAVSPAYVDACRSALGDLFTVVTLDCGHQIHQERAAETGRLIRDFLIAVRG